MGRILEVAAEADAAALEGGSIAQDSVTHSSGGEGAGVRPAVLGQVRTMQSPAWRHSMADEPSAWRTPESDDPNNPRNPPQVLLRRDSRRAALMSYVVPIVALFVIAGIALIYWANRGPVAPEPDQREIDAVGTAGGDSPGGFDPGPEFDRTRDELRFRGSNEATAARTPDIDPAETLGSVTGVLGTTRTGQRVEIEDLEVLSSDNGTMWVRSGETRIAVVVPDGTSPAKPGTRVNVSGITERGADSVMRIRASEIEVN